MFLTAQIAGFIALVALLAGCVLLHLRLRNVPSASFLLSIIGLATWALWLQDVVYGYLYPSVPAGDPGHGTNAAVAITSLGHSQTIAVISESILILWVGISFFFAIKSIRSQRAA